jgi:hypothetical protein
VRYLSYPKRSYKIFRCSSHSTKKKFPFGMQLLFYTLLAAADGENNSLLCRQLAICVTGSSKIIHLCLQEICIEGSEVWKMAFRK